MLETNEYFDGNVKSIAFKTATLPATVGVMEMGEYEFGTSQKETMTVVSGALTVKLPNASDWETFNHPHSYIVEEKEKFQQKCDYESAYHSTKEKKKD